MFTPWCLFKDNLHFSVVNFFRKSTVGNLFKHGFAEHSRYRWLFMTILNNAKPHKEDTFFGKQRLFFLIPGRKLSCEIKKRLHNEFHTIHAKLEMPGLVPGQHSGSPTILYQIWQKAYLTCITLKIGRVRKNKQTPRSTRSRVEPAGEHALNPKNSQDNYL